MPSEFHEFDVGLLKLHNFIYNSNNTIIYFNFENIAIPSNLYHQLRN